jgi:glutamate dehydrogenase
MERSGEHHKHVLVEEAAGLAASHATALSDDVSAAIDDFVRTFYEHVPPAEVVSHKPSDLSDAALSLWDFAAERDPGRPKIRVLSPSGTKEAWVGEHSTVQIINNDMPFLVDSISAALTGLGFVVRLIIHPVLAVGATGPAGCWV